MIKWYWQLTIIAMILIVAYYATAIFGFLKYFLIWSTAKEFLDFNLEPIWGKAGLIEIYGGAETGKTLLIVLLTQYLKGKKWSNVECNIPYKNDLTLKVMKKHRVGEFKNGIVGKNNVILIDEPWNFFSKAELKKANLERDLGNILWFMSETSKTDWKVFYVKKRGAKLPDAFNLLTENKTATIRTLGVENYCSWAKRDYFYLKIELIENDNKTQFGSLGGKKKSKLLQPWMIWILMIVSICLVGYFGFGISWTVLATGITIMAILYLWLNPNRSNNIIYIPFSSREIADIYDKTWNVDKVYEKNRTRSVAKEVKADLLTEGIKMGQSRRQKLREEQEAIAAWKRSKNRRAQAAIKGGMIAKEMGLYKTGEQEFDEQEALLQKQLEDGEITLEDYEIEIEILSGRQQKYAEKAGKIFPDPLGEIEKQEKKFPPKKGKGEKFKHENEEE